MRRPSAAREALGFSPLAQASWADSTRVERVPLIPACAEPFVFLAGRPAAERAADARGFYLAEFLLAVWNDGRIVGDGSHSSLL